MIQIFGVPYLKKGSGIHIKKKNRGKFTEYCSGKVTDECINRAKKSNNPKLRKRATFAANARKWKHANGGIFKYLNGTPEGGVQRSYIGGSTSEARKKYFNWDTELSLVVSNLAASYNVSPNLVFDRLSHEGIIDALIRDNNFWVNVRKAPNAPSFTFSNAFNRPYELFGLDNIYDTYTKGITKTKRPINIEKDSYHNESGEFVNSGTTNSFYDTLELFVAELASRRNQVKLLYPNLTDTELDSATAARYNATNKYFKQLMDSGEYKTKYPINVEGINIPAPTKTDSKYIKDQNIDIDIDYVIREGDPEIFLYNNKSWNPLLFMTDWLVDYPDSPIVKTFLKNYAKLNFSEPDMVNFTILHKEGGEINRVMVVQE